jgi:hypothetical protein
LEQAKRTRLVEDGHEMCGKVMDRGIVEPCGMPRRLSRASVVRVFPCVHAAANTPVQQLGVLFAHLAQLFQPSPIWPSGRPAHRPFRGLLSVHSRCGLHTRAVTNS